jgi:hypothetical protein
LTQLPPGLKEITTALKRKRGPDTTDAPDITADTWEGGLSPGHEMEREETMEEDESDGQLESAGHVNTAQLTGCRLTEASRITNWVCDLIDLNNH